MDTDTLIYQGGEVKSLDKSGKIGGHIVLFTTKNDPDTSGDYFDSDTDFDIEDGDRISGYFEHGFDIKIGARKIGKGYVTKDEKGLWMEGQIDKREKYAEEIIALIDAKKLGYSTGALSHLVQREAKNRAGTLNYITHWPLKEWSLLTEPCEPRIVAQSLKMWSDGIKGSALGDYTEHGMVTAAMDALNERLRSHIQSNIHNWYDESKTPDEKADAICAGLDEHAQTGKKMVRAMVGGNQAFTKNFIDKMFTGEYRPEIATIRECEDILRDAGLSRKHATKVALHGFNSLRDAGEPEPITPEPQPVPPIDEATKRQREFAFDIMAVKTEALRLAYGS